MDLNAIIAEGIKITSPDKIVFDRPKITKADVISYYEQVADRMLPYIRNRLLSTVRCPNGILQECFFKKHPVSNSKGIENFSVINKDNETDIFFYIKNVSGLVFETQMNTVEFHTWGSCVNTLEKPDIMVFDLDPDEEMTLAKVREGVRDIKNILDELSLKSYLKTSGGKGYHVVVPLKPTISWEAFYDFSKQIAQFMEQKWPDRYTSNVRKVSRKNKIFIDWMRNGRGSTSVAPYSLRARKGATVSMPIAWEELDKVAPNGVNMLDALKRIKLKDPWKDFFKTNNIKK